MNLCRINKTRSHVRRAATAIALTAAAASGVRACSALSSDIRSVLPCRGRKVLRAGVPHTIRARFSQRVPAHVSSDFDPSFTDNIQVNWSGVGAKLSGRAIPNDVHCP